MREICLVHVDKTRPALVLTREPTRFVMSKVTIAPITSTIKGLSSEVILDARNGLDHEYAVSIDNTLTIPAAALGRTVGYLTPVQEKQLARAAVFASDLSAPLSGRE